MTEPNDMYEVLDEHGVATGKLLDRKTVHRRGLWHAVANVWDVSVGTHVRPGETPVQAAVRALQTELGIAVMPDDLKQLFNILSPNPMLNRTMHRVLGHVYMVQRALELNDFHADPAKISKLAWVPLTQLMADIGGSDTRAQYFPRANNYYPQLFRAFQAWM